MSELRLNQTKVVRELKSTLEGIHLWAIKAEREGDIADGYCVQPPIFKDTNDMRVFQEEIFGPVLAVTTFKDDNEAMRIVIDKLYSFGAGVLMRSVHKAYRFGRSIQVGRVWTNCYHIYPAHSAFCGYKQSVIGRENHIMILDHYQQTKNMLVSYSPKAMGFSRNVTKQVKNK